MCSVSVEQLRDAESGLRKDQNFVPVTSKHQYKHQGKTSNIHDAGSTTTRVEKPSLWNRLTLKGRLLLATISWGFCVIWWNWCHIDRQRVDHLFKVDILDCGFKISDASLVNELGLLQTTAAFLFGAGLVSNFFSGAPWSADTIKNMNEWAPKTNQQLVEHMRTSTHDAASDWRDALIKYGVHASLTFRGLWGACMLLTFASVVLAHMARSTLFVCWSMAKNGIEGYKAEAKICLENLQLAGGLDVAALDEAELRKVAEDRYKRHCEAQGKVRGELVPLITWMAAPVSLTRALFNISLLLWMATILYAISEVFVVKALAARHSGTGVLVFAGLAALVTLYAYMVLVAKMWQTYAVFRPSDTLQEWRKRCIANGTPSSNEPPQHTEDTGHTPAGVSDKDDGKLGTQGDLTDEVRDGLVPIDFVNAWHRRKARAKAHGDPLKPGTLSTGSPDRLRADEMIRILEEMSQPKPGAGSP